MVEARGRVPQNNVSWSGGTEKGVDGGVSHDFLKDLHGFTVQNTMKSDKQ